MKQTAKFVKTLHCLLMMRKEGLMLICPTFHDIKSSVISELIGTTTKDRVARNGRDAIEVKESTIERILNLQVRCVMDERDAF